MTLPIRAVPGVLAIAVLMTFLTLTGWAQAADITPFVGQYRGSADMQNADGTTEPRDMSVTISETKDGFRVRWSTVSQKADGRIKQSDFTIDFLPTDRPDIFSAAMRRNVFGHAVQMDPMKGEPFVWGRVSGQTLTVYSLFVAEDGGYELQQYDRTLVEGGLMLAFTRLRNGDKAKSIETFLERY